MPRHRPKGSNHVETCLQMSSCVSICVCICVCVSVCVYLCVCVNGIAVVCVTVRGCTSRQAIVPSDRVMKQAEAYANTDYGQ